MAQRPIQYSQDLILEVRKRLASFSDSQSSLEKPRLKVLPQLPKNTLDLAKWIDHTLLKPDVTESGLQKVCSEAIEHNFASVCVNGCNIPFVTDKLQGSGVNPIAVVGFPLGAMTTAAKVNEAVHARDEGAQEIDMVVNIGFLKDKKERAVFEDIQAVVEAVSPAPVKVILETGFFDAEEIITGCVLSELAGAKFVKTSTGFGPEGADEDIVTLMATSVSEPVDVKASGGIRSFEDAIKMIRAGATRLGTSSGVAILEGQKGSADY